MEPRKHSAGKHIWYLKTSITMARSGYAKGANSGHVNTEKKTKVKPSRRKGVRSSNSIWFSQNFLCPLSFELTFYQRLSSSSSLFTFRLPERELFFAVKLPVKLLDLNPMNAEFWIWSRLADLQQTSAFTNSPSVVLVHTSVLLSREKISRKSMPSNVPVLPASKILVKSNFENNDCIVKLCWGVSKIDCLWIHS